MKKNLIILTLLVSFNLYSKQKEETGEQKRKPTEKYVKLENIVIKYLDGVTNCLDGDAIEEILIVRKQIEEEKLGILDPRTKTRTGKCMYEGKHCSYISLIKVEDVIKNQLNVQEDGKLKKELQIRSEELNKCLKQAKDHFINSTLGFMKRIEGTKAFVVKLIEESCKKRNINPKDTILLEWANTNGNEQMVLNEKIKNFKDLDKFLNQVFNFLGDLLKSCPKGFQQYKKNKSAKKS